MTGTFFLSTPSTPTEARLYRAQAEIFFTNAKGNVATSFIGGMAVAGVLWHYEARPELLAAWLGLFFAASMVLYLASAGYHEGISLGALARMLPRRIGAGLLSATLYGTSPFLLPVNAPDGATAVMTLILLVLFCIALMTYYVVPIYYVLLDITVTGPLLVYLVFFHQDDTTLLVALLVVAQVVLVTKGLSISRMGIDRLRANARLASEMARHMKAKQRIRHLALHDPLTAVANRRLFEEFWTRSAKLALREGKRLGLLFMDLDEFKPVNDELGHGAGDRVLKTVARRLEGAVRDVDLVSRYGGDEFYVLLEDVASHDALCMVAGKLDKAVAEPIQIGERSVTLTASIGCALFPDDGQSLEETIRTADERMYAAKKDRKQRTRTPAPRGVTF